MEEYMDTLRDYLYVASQKGARIDRPDQYHVSFSSGGQRVHLEFPRYECTDVYMKQLLNESAKHHLDHGVFQSRMADLYGWSDVQNDGGSHQRLAIDLDEAYDQVANDWDEHIQDLAAIREHTEKRFKKRVRQARKLYRKILKERDQGERHRRMEAYITWLDKHSLRKSLELMRRAVDDENQLYRYIWMVKGPEITREQNESDDEPDVKKATKKSKSKTDAKAKAKANAKHKSKRKLPKRRPVAMSDVTDSESDVTDVDDDHYI
jgi:hypothetical protein